MSSDRNRTAKTRTTGSNRPPRSLRKRVRRALRKATVTRIGTLVISRDGMPEFLLDATAYSSRGKSVYLWRAVLPRGHSVARLTDRPIQIEKEPFFAVLAESLAAAIHRGGPGGGILICHPTGMSRAVSFDGADGVTAAVLGTVAELLGGVAAPTRVSEGGSEQ